MDLESTEPHHWTAAAAPREAEMTQLPKWRMRANEREDEQRLYKLHQGIPLA